MGMTNILSCCLLLGYLFAIKLIAFKAHRTALNTSEDFFVFSRSLGGPLLWGTIIATIVNSLAFTAVPGLIYRGGILFLQMWFIVLLVPCLMWCFGPKIAQYARPRGILSQGRLFGTYYKSPTISVLTGFISILAVLPFLTIQLSAIAKVVSIASGGLMPYSIAILIFAITTGLYIYYGGSRAVVITDLFQGVCFFLLLLTSAILFSHWTGGVNEAVLHIGQVKPTLLTFTDKTKGIFIDNILSWPFAFFLWPQLFQRIFMARDVKEIKRSCLATLIIFGIIMTLIMIIGITATAHFVGTAMNPDTLVASMYQEFLPAGASLVVLGVVASGMSTLDSGLLSLTSVFTFDFSLQTVSSRNATSNGARTRSLILLAIIVVGALSDFGSGAITPLVTLGASFATLFIWPLLGMTYLVNVPKGAVIVSYLVGLLAIFAATQDWIRVGPGTAGFIYAGVAFLITCQVSVFLERLKRPTNCLSKSTRTVPKKK